jgi:cytochrome P450
LVTTFDLVEEVLGEPGGYSSVGAEISHIAKLGSDDEAGASILAEHFGVAQLNIADPPDHTRIRRAFGRSFVPREIAGYEERMRSIATRLIDISGHNGSLEAVSEFAEPLPVEVISDVIGVSEEHRAAIPGITLDQRFFFGENPPDHERARQFAESLRDWHRVLTEAIDHRRVQPSDDVLTRAARMIDDRRLTLTEALATCLHLIIAGNGTTTALIGNTLYLLLTHPEQMARVAANHALIAQAVEESLRFEAPLPRDRRIATRRAVLGGEVIHAGDRVVSVLAAANRDPLRFERPDEFDIDRSFTAAQHAAFGRGIHFCLGAPIARLEAKVAVEVFLTRYPSAALPDDFRPQWHPITTHRGLVSLPIEQQMAPA